MNKFLLKFFKFTFFLVIFLIIRTEMKPYYWGNELYQSKLLYYNKNLSNYNSVIFGSSRMYRHIIPSVLDTIVDPIQIDTYNFGTPATHNPEAYYQYEKFLNSLNGSNIKYAFVEIQSLVILDKSTVNTTWGSYWNTLPILFYGIKYVNSKNYFNENKFILKYSLFNSFIHRYLDFSDFLSFKKIKSFSKGDNGYFCVNEELVGKRKKMYSERFDKYHKDTLQIQERIDAIRTLEKTNFRNLYPVEAHLSP